MDAGAGHGACGHRAWIPRADRARAGAGQGRSPLPSCCCSPSACIPPPPAAAAATPPTPPAAGEERARRVATPAITAGASSSRSAPSPERSIRSSPPTRRRETSSAACRETSFTSTGSRRATESALAKSWKRSADGLTYTLSLRRGLRFSDGDAFDADDVVFTFKVLLDPALAAPHRDLLVVGGKPSTVTKVDSHTVRVTLAEPYAAAERLFDSIAILPRHLLETRVCAGDARRCVDVEVVSGLDRRTWPVSREALRRRPGARARAQPVLLEGRPVQATAAVHRRARVRVRRQRGRAGHPLPERRERRARPRERRQLHGPVEGPAGEALSAQGPRAEPRIQLPPLQPERSDRQEPAPGRREAAVVRRS